MCMELNLLVVFSVSCLLGAVVGSFLNVCIYRIPAGESIISPPSTCPYCGHRIRWHQNIPVISYIMLRGRCSSCRVHISFRYPAIEILTGGLFALALYSFGFSLEALVYWFFISVLIIITFIDLDHQIIPDVVSLPGIVFGFFCSFLIPSLTWVDSLSGILVGGGILLLIAWGYEKLAKREGMGGGDIKLLAMLGAFMGWQSVFPIIFLASLVGTLVGVPLMLFQKENSRLAIPFGPFLASAAIVYLFWGQQIIHWYLSLLGS